MKISKGMLIGVIIVSLLLGIYMYMNTNSNPCDNDKVKSLRTVSMVLIGIAVLCGVGLFFLIKKGGKGGGGAAIAEPPPDTGDIEMSSP